MGNQLLNESFIRQRSEELLIPYENLLAASILEEIVLRVAESVYAESIWMKDSIRLNLESYQNHVNRSLTFYIKDTKKFHYKKTEISGMFAALFRNLKKDAVHWNYNVWADWNIIYVNLSAELSSIKVPVKIKFDKVEAENLEPCRKDIRLFINNNRMIHMKCFPSEYVITEKIIEILDKLELINDFSSYMEMYEILKKEVLSGRKVCELLQEKYRERGIEIEESRLQMFLSYRSSSYMKKKWKSYLKHEDRKHPSWDEMIDILEQFLLNIWEYLCRDLIYLGDWIPEFGRFMDWQD